ncbi:response regulator [bacterium]|nr:response regulator [bacterium]
MSKKMRILVVDADQAFRQSVTNLLLIRGVEEFEVASTAKEALEKSSRALYDMVFIDLFMPKMSGLQLAKEFQRRMPTAKIILMIDDQHQPVLNSEGQAKLDFPTILKSFVNRILPQLLSEEEF